MDPEKIIMSVGRSVRKSEFQKKIHYLAPPSLLQYDVRMRSKKPNAQEQKFDLYYFSFVALVGVLGAVEFLETVFFARKALILEGQYFSAPKRKFVQKFVGTGR